MIEDTLSFARGLLNGGAEELNEINFQERQAVEEPLEPPTEVLELDVRGIPSPTLFRLIEEVRNEEADTAHAYNRMHNRHNRSR
jgi:hypothetical protein